tara:strand:- start:33 stop:671 length:639 start_codon:yes stop_codon:yes gene_type:complete
MKNILFEIIKTLIQLLLVMLMSASFLALVVIFKISGAAPFIIDSIGEENLSSNGWLIYLLGNLIFLYPFRKFKLIYAEFFSVLGASMLIILFLWGTVYVETDGQLILNLFILYFTPKLYYEKTYKTYKLKGLFKFDVFNIPIPNKLHILLLDHKRKVFLSSIIILTITIINFADEVILGGQGLFSSPEELFGWIIGFYLGIGGLVFIKKTKS